jgi:ankyrin repeat protein
MFFAAAYSTADVISEMINYKAVTTVKDTHNRMPVHHAILKSKTQNLKVLVD